MWHTAITSRDLSLARGVWILSPFCQCVPAYSARVAGTDLRILLRSYSLLFLGYYTILRPLCHDSWHLVGVVVSLSF